MNTTPRLQNNEAHQIGVELADRLLEGKYSYIVTTHIDKGHVHNHIIFCAADNVSHEKYHDCKKTYYNIRSLSDRLCREHQLSVITPEGKSLSAKGKKYHEWQSERNNDSWKVRLKNDIDKAVKAADTYAECIDLIRAKGYEIKGETFDENALKYISFRPSGTERFVRGSVRSLGADYTKERIKERIGEKPTVSTMCATKNQRTKMLICAAMKRNLSSMTVRKIY